MPYRFKLGEPIQKGARRILLEQIDAADQRLSGAADAAAAIHDARKGFKRIRALLRLVRPGIGSEVFRAENLAFRDIAGLLASARDRHVLLQTIAALEAAGDRVLKTAAPAMREALASDTAGSADAGEAGPRVAEARDRLKAARKRVARLRLEPDGFAPIEQGLRDTQHRAVAAMRQALAEESDEAFHEWRKGVQQHWRQMQLLSPAWPDYLQVRGSLAKSLSQTLGEDHDLSLLALFAADRARSGLAAAQARDVEAVCRAAQAVLRAKAVADGRRLFAGSPKALARHLAALWSAAVGGAETATQLPKPARVARSSGD